MTTPSIVDRLVLIEQSTNVSSLAQRLSLSGEGAWWSGTRPLKFLAALMLLVTVDMAKDIQDDVGLDHVVFEILTMALLCAAVATIWIDMLRARRKASELIQDLERATDEAKRWRGEARTYLDGLGEAIERQFGRWQLTPSERDVGLLLLKGLSHKEIAGIRSTSEQTVRSQAFALYRKASLRGRHDLAAFFLEDLLLPSQG